MQDNLPFTGQGQIKLKMININQKKNKKIICQNQINGRQLLQSGDEQQ